jgi:hypothetical protein
MIVKKLTSLLPAKLVPICEWYKKEVASFTHVYFDGYPAVRQRLAPIIMAEEPEIKVILNGNNVRVSIKMFDDSVGGSLDKQTPTSVANGRTKKHTGNPELGWWRFFEEGEIGRNWGSDEFGFVKTGNNKGFMAPFGSLVRLKSGKVVPVANEHPGVIKIGVFEKTWDDLKEEFATRIHNAVREVVLN